MKVSLMGCGSMANAVVKYFTENSGNVEFNYLYSRTLSSADSLSKEYRVGRPTSDPNDILNDSESDLLIECASQGLVFDLLPELLSRNRKVLVMSCGAFSNSKFYDDIMEKLRNGRGSVIVTHGAIGGIDALRSASLQGVDEVTLETRKNPISLGLDIESETSERILFEGSAKEAIPKFPANVNVAAILSLASIGFDRTKVRIVSDPSVDTNSHSIFFSGPAGHFSFKFVNAKSPLNPKTSSMAILSLIGKIKELGEKDQFTVG